MFLSEIYVDFGGGAHFPGKIAAFDEGKILRPDYGNPSLEKKSLENTKSSRPIFLVSFLLSINMFRFEN